MKFTIKELMLILESIDMWEHDHVLNNPEASVSALETQKEFDKIKSKIYKELNRLGAGSYYE